MLSHFNAIIANNLFALEGVSAAGLFLTSEFSPSQSLFDYSATVEMHILDFSSR